MSRNHSFDEPWPLRAPDETFQGFLQANTDFEHLGYFNHFTYIVRFYVVGVSVQHLRALNTTTTRSIRATARSLPASDLFSIIWNGLSPSPPLMPFGEIVCGSPGSGKSTYCYGKHQLLTALNRPISIVNLDPANDTLPYPCAVDISSLITLKDVVDEHRLGPNGGMLYCMEYLEANFDWLEERLRELGPDAYVVFDLPGQVELSTNHESVKRIVEKLTKIGFRVSWDPQHLFQPLLTKKITPSSRPCTSATRTMSPMPRNTSQSYYSPSERCCTLSYPTSTSSQKSISSSSTATWVLGSFPRIPSGFFLTGHVCICRLQPRLLHRSPGPVLP